MSPLACNSVTATTPRAACSIGGEPDVPAGAVQRTFPDATSTALRVSSTGLPSANGPAPPELVGAATNATPFDDTTAAGPRPRPCCWVHRCFPVVPSRAATLSGCPGP